MYIKGGVKSRTQYTTYREERENVKDLTVVSALILAQLIFGWVLPGAHEAACVCVCVSVWGFYKICVCLPVYLCVYLIVAYSEYSHLRDRTKIIF